MQKLPILSGKEIVKILGKIGYRQVRQHGSHIRLAYPNRKSITIPDYKMVSRRLLLKILRDAELTKEQFLKLLER